MLTGATKVRTITAGALAAFMLAIVPAAQADQPVTYTGVGVCNEASHAPKGQDWQAFADNGGDHSGGNLMSMGNGNGLVNAAQHSKALGLCGYPVSSPSSSDGGVTSTPFN